jgi:hypothetical protein
VGAKLQDKIQTLLPPICSPTFSFMGQGWKKLNTMVSNLTLITLLSDILNLLKIFLFQKKINSEGL